MTQTIGVAIIARNSQGSIRDCLESFKDHVDQVVVVLAGQSTDKTEEIVRSIEGVEVYNFEWIDDFATARNFSFSKLTTDWMLWVDSDDVVLSPERIKYLISNADNRVGCIWLPYHYAVDEFGNVTTLYERERLLRSNCGWAWKGRLHETVSPLQQCIFVRSDEVIIRHNHIVGGSRNDRNFKLLNIMLKESPDDKRIWLYLGHQNFAAGNWTESAEWYLKFGSDNTVVALERYQALCYCSKALRELNDHQAAEVATMAITLFPEYRDAYLELAHACLMLEEYDKAIHWAKISDLKELIQEPPSVIFINPLEYTFNKYCLLSECYMKKGDYNAALDYMSGAYQIRPVPDVERNVELIRNLASRERIIGSIKVMALTLFNNRELLKLNNFLSATPYWFRDTDEYKALSTNIQKHLSDVKDEPLIVEGEDKSVMVNIANATNPVELLKQMDKYDKVTVIAPMPTPESKQINVYSQKDIEQIITSKEGRHIINLQREPNRLICEYDKKLPADITVRFFLGQGLELWNPKTITNEGCGGSETWAALTAKALAQKGCNPIIYAMDNQVWDGVIYRSYKDYRPKSMASHLFISSRVPDVFYDDITTDQKWLWVHDIHCWNKLTPDIAEKLDVIVCLSQWHAGHLKRVYPFLKDAEIIDFDNNKLTYDDKWTGATFYADVKVQKLPKLAIIGNGIDTTRFEAITEQRIPHRFIWCSAPDRGLEQVLNMWQLIKKRLPDAELKIFYGWEYFNSSLFIPAQRELKQRLLKLIKQDGVEWCGRVGQHQIAKELMKADVMLYPPPHDFRETYGIAFLEAQAAGVLCVYRKNGALGETIGNRGIALELNESPESIVDKIVTTLADKIRHGKIRERARKYALNRTWDSQTDKLLTLYRRIRDG